MVAFNYQIDYIFLKLNILETQLEAKRNYRWHILFAAQAPKPPYCDCMGTISFVLLKRF